MSFDINVERDNKFSIDSQNVNNYKSNNIFKTNW